MRSPLSLKELLTSGCVLALHNSQYRVVWDEARTMKNKQCFFPETCMREQRHVLHEPLKEVVEESYN